ncbi:hypothetical protein GMOD_00003959 [Pyrenophora seminiperda CCB06]|uniref:Uncharacterized protein n=1 Tax=Pyrenophora seminiperda CCB06 TaxID=1302712 RepID=A0A3M7M052_9PLEO|nr:hypothetical protein GMOD_00003959 [Pyrenophora seminiperda CCB06]
MLSMASMTKSGCCPFKGANCAAAVCSLKSSFRHSKCVHGVICSSRLRRQCTLGVPTSAKVATACRFREDNVTWSKSMSRIFEHPERARAAVACEPTPPHPTTTTKALRNLASPVSVRKTLFLANCSRIKSVKIVRASVEDMLYVQSHTIIIVAFPCSCS